MSIPLEYADRTKWAPSSQEEYTRYLQYEKERLDHQHNVITSLSELNGWSITLLIRWKPGVVRFFARRGNEQQMGFAKDEVFAAIQLPP